MENSGIAPHLLLVLDGCEWSASCSNWFTYREKTPVPITGLESESPRASLDAVVKRKIPCSYQELNLIHPVYSLSHYSDSATMAVL
jgi:hypothetical protein